MASAAQTLPQRETFSHWFPQFLRDELRLYPGRLGKIGRITLSCVLTFIVLETFRIPGAVFGVISVFLISRDTPRDTIRTTVDSVLASIAGVSMVLIGAPIFADSRFIHFFFLIGGYFLLFFLLRTFVNPIVAPNFAVGFYAASVIWDGASSPSTQVEATLWALLSLCLGLVTACIVELVFVRRGAVEQLLKDIDDRIHAAAEVFLHFCDSRDESVKQRALEKIASLAVVGTGRLRQEMEVITKNHSYSLTYYAGLSAIIALTGRLVDVTATLNAVATHPTEQDRQRLRVLFEECERIRVLLLRGEELEPSAFHYQHEYSAGLPALPVLERTVALFPVAFQNAGTSGTPAVPSFDSVSKARVFVNDAFTNPDHLRFAVKGTLAAVICYVIYSSVDWPGISTAVFSCFITSLSTVGASKQKQFNRFMGSLAGGVLGIGSLIFLVPSLDGITGISLVIAVGTALSAWFWTASPRISYFGIQMALGFYLTLLQGFGVPTSLEPPRDRLVGVLLSVVVMAVVFDKLWPALAASHIQIEFARTLRKMAQFARLIVASDPSSAGVQIASLRESINTGFATAHTDADAIKFEFGSTAEVDQGLRDSILHWQSAARTLYLLELTLGRHLVTQRELHAIPPALDAANTSFCNTVAQALEVLADRVDRKMAAPFPDLRSALAGLEKELSTWFSTHTETLTAERVSGILATGRQIVAMLQTGDAEIRVDVGTTGLQPSPAQS